MNAIEYYTWRMTDCFEAAEYYRTSTDKHLTDAWRQHQIKVWTRHAEEYKAKLEVAQAHA